MQYIIDDRGVKTSVIVPFNKWEKINEDYQKLQNKLKVLIKVKQPLFRQRTSQSNNRITEFIKYTCNTGRIWHSTAKTD